MTYSMHRELHLRPTDDQLEVLDVLLEGPVFIQRLLAMQPTVIDSLEDAGRFLDKNWIRVAPYMFQPGARKSPRSIESLILDIAQQRQDGFTLSFPSQCAFGIDASVMLPIPDLGGLHLADLESVQRMRQGMRHTGAFSLTRTDEGYFVGVEFFPLVRPLHPATKSRAIPQLASAPKQDFSPEKLLRRSKPAGRSEAKRLGMAVAAFLKAFNNRIAAKLRASNAYAGSRFADLSGRPVSGGLPSLPRRR